MLNPRPPDAGNLVGGEPGRSVFLLYWRQRWQLRLNICPTLFTPRSLRSQVTLSLDKNNIYPAARLNTSTGWQEDNIAENTCTALLRSASKATEGPLTYAFLADNFVFQSLTDSRGRSKGVSYFE